MQCNENKVRNDNTKTALGEYNIARGSTRQAGETEMVQRLLFILINVLSHPGFIANIYKEEN